MHREMLLLGLLRQKEMHGYRLTEFIDQMLGVCSDLKRSTAYFLLEKLARQGYVTETTAKEGNYPERKVYSITPEGDARFLELLRENLSAFERPRYPGDIGLAFIHELPAEERLELLRSRRERIAAEIAALEAIPPHGGSLDLVFGRNLALLRAELDWLDAATPKVAGLGALVDPGLTRESAHRSVGGKVSRR